MNRSNTSTSKLPALFTAAGVPCAVGSFWLTYEGLLAQSGNRPFSLVLSGVASVVSVLVLHVLCQLLPRADAAMRLKLIVGVGFPGLGFVLATSTSMAVLGMAAPEAQRLDMRAVLDQAEVRLEQGQIQQQHQAKAVQLLRTQADQLGVGAQSEEETGIVLEKGSGSRSVQDLQALAQAYVAAAGILEEDQSRRLAAAEDASEALGELRNLVDGAQANAGDLREIEQGYLRHLRELNISLAELEQDALEGDLLAPVTQMLAAQRDTPFKSSKSSRRRGSEANLDAAQLRRIRQSQTREQQEKQAALAGLHERNQQILEDTQAALAALRGETHSSQRLKRRSPMEAVWVHRRAVAPLIAFPVVLDMAIPLIALVVLSLLGSMTPPSSPSQRSLPETPIYETPSPRMRLSQLRAASSGQRGAGAQRPVR